jgi:hypothetical protein
MGGKKSRPYHMKTLERIGGILMQTHLRPMGIGEIFDRCFYILRTNFGTLVKLHGIAFLPVYILLALALVGAVIFQKANPFFFQKIANPESLSPGLALLVIGLFLLFIFFALLVMAVIYVNIYGIYRIFDAGVRGEKITWRQALKGWPLGALFLFIAGIILAIAGGTVGFAAGIPIMALKMVNNVLGELVQFAFNMIISVFTVLAMPIVVLERKDPVTPVWRSICLTVKNFWRALGVILLSTLLYMCLYVLITVLFLLPFFWIMGMSGVTFDNPEALLNMLLTPGMLAFGLGLFVTILLLSFILFHFNLGIQVIMLYDFKIRSEGYDLLPPEEVGITVAG